MSTEVVGETNVWQEVPHNLPPAITAALIQLAVASPEAEVCGFILEDGTVCDITNVEENPLYGFRMDHAQMMAVVNGPVPIVASFHSHPSGRPWPSAGDSETMTFLYQQGCPWRYLVVTGGGVYEFRHRDRASD